MKANVNGLTHQVAELDESLKSHQAKHAGRQRLAAKAAQQEEEAAPPPPAEVAAEALVPSDMWDVASEAQQIAWEAQGLRRAG